ncbi:MAG: helix-hairpin-helix domain-containing protein, partial [Flammeovirgaceae bacterium]|nr:helix-hairpin-helix domain-containing protein [Flammeovirgaceae bacterium]MDW8288243.1 helix-hairpin-helix domain-containing protein [Flammeovirgaceae bacterium]
YEDLFESLFQFYRNPLDLNKATRADLQNLYLLSEDQINSLLKHRQKYGDLLSIYELQAVEGFDYLLIQKILPFVVVKEAGTLADTRSLWERIRKEENQFVLTRLERTLEARKGFIPRPQGDTDTSPRAAFAGSPEKLYTRYRSSRTNDFSIGFTMEKDPGERNGWNPARRQYGMDFLSYHATFYNKGNFKAIALGDYNLQIGQGLLLAGGFQLGKGAETTLAVRRNTRGILPYTSALEFGFFRGAAATYQLNRRIDLTAFYSHRFRDSTFTQTGLHRTKTELQRRAAIREQVYGGHLTYRNRANTFASGITAYYLLLSDSIGSARLQPYNQFSFRNDRLLALGADFTYNYQNFNFFGEIAHTSSNQQGIGAVVGFVSSLSRTVEYALLFRHYARDFHTLYGNAFGENTTNLNETGIYMGIKIKPNKKWTLAAYYDNFRFPWMRYLADAPSVGFDWLARLSYQPNKQLLLYLQYRYEEKARNLRENTTKIDFTVPTTRRQYLFNVRYKANDFINLQSRLQGTIYKQDTAHVSEGFLLFQDIDFIISRQLTISTRLAVFDTDTYDARQYAYEKNVLYAFAFPAYYGIGIRNYYLVHY